jgi:predicted nucleic acid-binding protein
MRLVVDANILFAALIKNGMTSDLMSEHELYSPLFLIEEFKSYESELKNKTSRTDEEFDFIFKILTDYIIFVDLSYDLFNIQKAIKISPDPKDVVYVALALKLQCPIWSNDKKLKEQKEVIVYSTDDLLKILP